MTFPTCQTRRRSATSGFRIGTWANAKTVAEAAWTAASEIGLDVPPLAYSIGVSINASTYQATLARIESVGYIGADLPDELSAVVQWYFNPREPYSFFSAIPEFDDNGDLPGATDFLIWSMYDETQKAVEDSEATSKQFGDVDVKPVWCDEPVSGSPDATPVKGYGTNAADAVLIWDVTAWSP